jgi:hypothetical protein
VKRTALVAALALIAVGPAVAHAGPKASKRTLTATYQHPVAVSVTTGLGATLNCTGPMAGCWEFSTVKGEKTVTISAKDSTGTPTGLQIFTDDDYANNVQFFCGTGTITVSPKVATPVGVRIAFDPSCAGVPTSGTLTAVITNK